MSATAQKNGRAPRVPLVAPLPTLSPVEPPAVAEVATPNLDAAVLRVVGRAFAQPLPRDANGQVGSRTYSYPTLGAVLDVVLPLTVEEELLWKVFPTTLTDGKPGLRYRMTHVPSGEYDEDTMPLPCEATMQGLGSAITYGRRYGLVAYLNLIVEDDDGAAASVRHTNVMPKASDPDDGEAPRPKAATPKSGERRVTANQRTKLLEPRAQAAGLDAGQFANVILTAAGEPPRTWRNEQHAEETKKRLLDQLPARLKDAVLAGIAHAAAEGSQA